MQTPVTTWLSRTGRGIHQWFQHPGVTIGNRAGVRPHLDVRGDGGYVVAPPSLHASGRRYEWITPPERMALAPLPDHVLALLTTVPPAASPTSPAADDLIPEGQRNDRLFRLTRSLIQRGLSAGAVHVAVAEENRARCRPPLPDHEVRAVVEHALVQPHRGDFQPEARARSETPIEIIDAADLVRRDFPNEPPALVGGGLIVPRAFVVNGGPAKRGKSLVVLNREICRAIGRPFLGFPTTPGRTLYVQAEIPEPQLKQRLVLMLSEAPTVGRLDGECLRGRLLTVTRRGLFIDELAGYDALRRLIEQTQPDLVSLDPLARFMTGEENSARDVGRLINSLDRLIQEYRIAIELTHHAGKSAAGDPRQGGQRLRGSSALFGAADTVTMLDRTQESWTLSFELRHAEEPPPMTLQRSPALWFTTAGPPEKLLAVAEHVRLIPLRYSTLTGAIVSESKCSPATAERLVRDAKKAGLVWQDHDGLYRATINRHHGAGDGAGSAE